MPTPSEVSFGINDVSKAQRNANARMLIERIATKDKIEFTWSYLTASELTSLLTAVKGTTFSVTFTHPQTGLTKTGTFYAGDRTVEVMDYYSSVPRYKNAKFNVIEV
jgi:hypothetical protein